MIESVLNTEETTFLKWSNKWHFIELCNCVKMSAIKMHKMTTWYQKQRLIMIFLTHSGISDANAWKQMLNYARSWSSASVSPKGFIEFESAANWMAKRSTHIIKYQFVARVRCYLRMAYKVSEFGKDFVICDGCSM